MDEQQPAPALATAFPAPPPYWQSFTPENLERIAELRAAQNPAKKIYNAGTELPLRILDLPPELRWLQPPAEPQGGKYKCFGDDYNLQDPLLSLKDLNVEQLYTPPDSPTVAGVERHTDRAFYLKKLAKSLLLNFLELVGVLSINANDYAEKTEDLNTLFSNFHHLLNEYRPHQARESLILMMQDQLDRSRAETQGIKDMRVKVEGILEGLSQAKLADSEDADTSGKDDSGEREVWDELAREFD